MTFSNFASDVIRREPLVEQTARAIRRAILDGAYSLGQKLGERELMTRFGSSSSVVREALHVLQGERIVVAKPYCGRSVFRIEENELPELIVMRAQLESLAAYLAAKKITPSRADVIQATARAMTAGPPASYGEWADREIDFHQAVWEASGNDSLGHHLKQLTIPLLTFGALNMRSVTGAAADLVWRETASWETGRHPRGHQMLAEAIATGKPRESYRLMVRHLSELDDADAREIFGISVYDDRETDMGEAKLA